MQNKPLLIGLHGRARSGKDTIADYLVKIHGFEKVSFAAPIREMACKIFNCSLKQLECIKEVVDPCLGVSPRDVMQTLGTEWGRNINPDLWVITALRHIRSAMSDGISVVVSDVHFDNEAHMIRDNGGEIWTVIRPEVKHIRKHPSERGIAYQEGDRVICNTTTLGDLYHRTNLLCNTLASSSGASRNSRN